MDGIPDKYQWHWVVFDEDASYRFPPSQEDDHAIKLKARAPDVMDCKVYPLTPLKLEATTKWIKENLERKYIRLSKSAYVAPFFFIKKKDGMLQPIQDY